MPYFILSVRFTIHNFSPSLFVPHSLHRFSLCFHPFVSLSSPPLRFLGLPSPAPRVRVAYKLPRWTFDGTTSVPLFFFLLRVPSESQCFSRSFPFGFSLRTPPRAATLYDEALCVWVLLPESPSLFCAAAVITP